jgi:hypothetical protein
MDRQQKQAYFKTISRMDDAELKRRIKNFDFLIERINRGIEHDEDVLANPEKARARIEQLKKNVEEHTICKKIMLIKLQGLLE